MKDRNRSRPSQVAQLVREHEQAGLLPEWTDRWGKRQQGWEEPLPSEVLQEHQLLLTQLLVVVRDMSWAGSVAVTHPQLLTACFDWDSGSATSTLATTENTGQQLLLPPPQSNHHPCARALQTLGRWKQYLRIPFLVIKDDFLFHLGMESGLYH